LCITELETDFARHKVGKDQFFKRQEYIYIPLLKQIERLLNIPAVYDEVKKMKTSVPGRYSSYEDGTRFKRSPLFQQHRDALQIHLYLDEVQLCNPIGSYDHKIVFVYFAIGNLDLKFRSTFKSINLLSVFYNHQVNEFSFDLLLAPIVDDLKKLELGVEFIINQKKETFFGTLTAVVADNLASHQVGGFKCGFGSGFRKCRYCLAVASDIQKKFSECLFPLRTKESHDAHCAELQVEELQAHFSWLYGIKKKTILNELKYFHVISGLPPDIMHDMLEGTIPLTICELLIHCLKQKYFTLASLNRIIRDFDYGYAVSSDKPSVIKIQQLKSRNLKGSATQKWLLFTHLPLMIGSLVPNNDSAWRVLTNLLDISRLIFCDSISSFECIRLGDLIESFLKKIKRVSNRNIIPKMHHLVHYPRLITLLGPLLSFWCMRYESKHAYFKSLIKRINNWINVPWT